jgi:hypothetical protein
MDVESGDADDKTNGSLYKGPKKNWKSEQYIKEHMVDTPMLFRMMPLPLTFILAFFAVLLDNKIFQHMQVY